MGGSGRLSQNPSSEECGGSVGDKIRGGNDDDDDDDDDWDEEGNGGKADVDCNGDGMDEDDDMDVDDIMLIMASENFLLPHWLKWR